MRRSLLAPPLRGLVIVTIVATVVVGAIVWFFGLDTAASVFVGLAAGGALLGAGLVWESLQGPGGLQWPAPPLRRTPGARVDVEELGWSMKTRGGVHERTLARAREFARRRLLFLYGLDLFDPVDRGEIEKVLAPGVVRTLMTQRTSNLDLISFSRLLNALEALGAPPTAPTRTERHS